MAETRRRSFAQVWLDWKNDVLSEHKLTWHLWALLTYLQARANPWTGIVTANAQQLADELEAPSERLVQDCLSRLRALLYIWYPGERAGLRHYPIFLEGFERKGSSVLKVFGPRGQIVGEAASYLKKMAPALPPVRVPGKVTVSPTVSPSAAPGATVEATVADAKPAESGRSTGGSTNGSGQGECLTLPGFCPDDAGNLRPVPVGVDVGAPPTGYRSSESQNVLDPPVSPAGTPTPRPPPAHQVDLPGPSLQAQVHSLCLSFVGQLDDLAPGTKHAWPNASQRQHAEKLLEAHGERRVEDAIRYALSRTRFARYITTFGRLAAQFEDITHEMEVNQNVATREHRPGSSKPDAVPERRPEFREQGSVEDLG